MGSGFNENRFLRRVPAREWVFREGDPGDCAFVIESGEIEVLRQRGGEVESIAHLTAGDLLGEMALIDGRTRSASARALTDVRLRMVTVEQLSERLAAADPMLRVLLKVLLARYRNVLAPDRPAAGYPDADDADRAAMRERLEMEQDLRLALERGEFELLYQPIVALESLRTAGFEALLRWNRPRGVVPAGEFVPVAEASGLIVEIGRWIVREASAALARMAPHGETFMSINLSGRQLAGAETVGDVQAALHDARLPARRIKLEITESLLMQDLECAVRQLAQLRESGVRIAIDDFGTGYSSLAYLHRLPVDTLKIDRSFVGRIVDDAPSRAIVGALGSLSRRLGMDVVAEGAESDEQVQALRDMGFLYAQGFHFSRAVREAEAGTLLDRRWSPQPA